MKRLLTFFIAVVLCVTGMTFSVVAEKSDKDVAVCPRCGREGDPEDIWVNSMNGDYDPTGFIILFLKSGVTREMFSETPSPYDLVKDRIIGKYLPEFVICDLKVDSYSENLAFVESIVSGEFLYHLTVRFNLEDKSEDNIRKAIENLGYSSCSDFHSAAAVLDEEGYQEDESLIPEDYDLNHVGLVLKYIAGWNVEIDVLRFDLDENEKINLQDAALMLKKLAG